MGIAILEEWIEISERMFKIKTISEYLEIATKLYAFIQYFQIKKHIFSYSPVEKNTKQIKKKDVISLLFSELVRVACLLQLRNITLWYPITNAEY